MKISQKGLYALQAMMMLARRYHQGAIRIREIAYEEGLPEKFLELILLELKNARMVESVRGAKGGYQLRRPPSEIYLSEIVRLIDGAIAPSVTPNNCAALSPAMPNIGDCTRSSWMYATLQHAFWKIPVWPTS